MKAIRKKLTRIADLMESWSTAGPDEIERDLVLELLRKVYAELKFETKTTTRSVKSGKAEAAEKEPAAEPASEPEATTCTEQDKKPATEPVVAEEILVEAAAVIEKVANDTAEDTVAVRSRRLSPDVIRSLYGTEQDHATITADSPAITSAAPVRIDGHEPVATLGDTMAAGQTIGDTLRGDALHGARGTVGAGHADTVASKLAAAESSSLKGSFGLNDRFLVVRDLFGGDTAAFEAAIDRLEGFADPDEAIIYIHDTYDWDADSPAVQLLVELLERKLG